MKIGPPLVLPLLRRRGRIIWYSEQGLHGRIYIFVARSILFSLVCPVLESKAKKNPSLCCWDLVVCFPLCVCTKFYQKLLLFLFECCCWIYCVAKKREQKKSKKKRRESVRKCAIIFSLVRNFRSCSGKCCNSNVVQGSTKNFLFIWIASIGSQH